MKNLHLFSPELIAKILNKTTKKINMFEFVFELLNFEFFFNQQNFDFKKITIVSR